MTTGVAGYSRHKFLGELLDALWTPEGWLSPADQQAKVLENLGITQSIADINLGGASQILAATGGAVTVGPSGQTIYIPAITANATVALGTPDAGRRYRFVYVGGATDAEDWVITATGVLFSGGVAWLTHGTPDIEPVYANGSTHNTLTINNPATGTWVEVVGNGAAWVVTGQAIAANTPAFSAV